MSLIRTVFTRLFNPLTGGVSVEARAPQEEQSSNTSSFQMAGTTKEAIYQKLVAVARGDAHQVLPVMDAISRGRNIDEAFLFDRIREVGAIRPYEAGHLMTCLFERASTKTRLAILEEFVDSPRIGDKHAVGDLFVMLMEKSTADERREEIYPALYSIIEAASGNPQPVQGKRAFLIALLKGWMSEI